MKTKIMVAAAAYVPSIIHNIYTNKIRETLRKESRCRDWRVVCVPFDSNRNDIDGHIEHLYDRTSILLRKLDSDAG